MGVYIKDSNYRWPLGFVPYECTDDWTEREIDAFNSRLGCPIFQPRFLHHDPVDYLVFKPFSRVELGHSFCKTGCRGGQQDIRYKNERQSIHHEMAHALGLGHENYHRNWPRWDEVKGMMKMDFKCEAHVKLSRQYKSYGDFDLSSVMLYSSEYLGLPKLPVVREEKRNPELSQGDIELIHFLFPQVPSVPYTVQVLDMTYGALPSSIPLAMLPVPRRLGY